MTVLSDSKKLFIIKLMHTLIWFFMAAAVLYICYAGIFNKINGLVWYCVGMITIEGFILLVNRWRCPLTLAAGRYTDLQPVGFDIYLPQWLAKHNKTIFTVLFVLGLALVIYRTWAI